MNAIPHRWLLPLLWWPAPLLAHSPIDGIGDFYNGVIHPLFVPSQWLVIMALGLLIGQQQAHGGRAVTTVMSFLFALLLGLSLAWFFPANDIELFLLGLAGLLGLAVAAAFRLSAWMLPLAALSGLVLGLDSSLDGLSGEARFVGLFGSSIGIFLLHLYPLALAEWANSRPWTAIGIRVIGSWLAASALLVMTLNLAQVLPAS